jgi:hypothetical protein
MKNVLGLVIAVTLGLAAAVLNWTYLERKSREVEMVSFLAVADGVRIRQGDVFQESHFTAVEIPRKQVGRLQDTAVLHQDRHTVIGMKAIHNYDGGEIVLRQDLKTPPAELTLAENERVMWIPVDSGTFVPSLVAPGNLVSFIVPKALSPADAALASSANGQATSNQHEIIGPFRIVSLGNRLGSQEVFRAAGMPGGQENVLGISVQVEKNELEARAQKLFDRLKQTNFRQVGVLLHPKQKNP